MDMVVDTVDILAHEEIIIDECETATTLHKKVDEAHVSLFLDTLPNLISGNFNLQQQCESKATYWEGRTPADGEIKAGMSAKEVDRLIRATTHPYPGAVYINEEGGKIVVWSTDELK